MEDGQAMYHSFVEIPAVEYGKSAVAVEYLEEDGQAMSDCALIPVAIDGKDYSVIDLSAL